MRDFTRKIIEDKVGLVGLIGVLLVVLLAIFAPIIAPYAPDKMHTRIRWKGRVPSFFSVPMNLVATIFSRVVYGAQVSLQVGLIAVGIGAFFGLLFGLLAGFFQGKIDQFIMRIMDIFFAFPDILLALTIVAVLGPSLTNTMIAIGIVFTPVFTRLIRSAVLTVKENEYITNAEAVGVSNTKIIVKHIAPNVMAPFIVQITLALSGAILTEAGLSFLGLGVQPPDPSWGVMLNESRSYMEIAPWMMAFPVTAIIITIFCFNLLGDSLRDLLDPKLKQ